VWAKHVKKGHAQALIPSQFFFGFAKPYSIGILGRFSTLHTKSHCCLSTIEDASLKWLVLQQMWEGCLPI
jgi:hypothetical protein